MTDRELRLSRRKFLTGAALGLAATQSSGSAAEPAPPPGQFLSRPPKPATAGRKPLAVLTTVHRPMSHSYHVAGRFLHGYARNGAFHVPQYYVRGMAVDQTPDNDLSRDLAREFGFRWSRNP